MQSTNKKKTIFEKEKKNMPSFAIRYKRQDSFSISAAVLSLGNTTPSKDILERNISKRARENIYLALPLCHVARELPQLPTPWR